jgi:hypothetical protein
MLLQLRLPVRSFLAKTGRKLVQMNFHSSFPRSLIKVEKPLKAEVQHFFYE